MTTGTLHTSPSPYTVPKKKNVSFPSPETTEVETGRTHDTRRRGRRMWWALGWCDDVSDG